MIELTSGRSGTCKDSLGGAKHLYLMDYLYYPVNLIGGYTTNTITSFPTTFMVKYEAVQINVSENYSEDGSKQEISFKLPKIDVDTHVKANLLNGKRVRAISEGYDGKFRIYGLLNGMDVEVGAFSGSSKSDFNGYDVKMNGLEEKKSHFISNLIDAGFYTEGLIFGSLLASSSRPSSLGNEISDTNILQ